MDVPFRTLSTATLRLQPTAPHHGVFSLFHVCYGLLRLAAELVRLPDAQLGYLAFDWLTMGQVLSAPMVAFGALLLILAYRRRAAAT